MDRTVVKRIGQLVTPVGKVPRSGNDMDQLKIGEDKEILIEGDRISKIGDRGDFSKEPSGNTEIIDAGDKPVLPGFIDPHTHFVFSGYRAGEFRMRLQGKSYEEIADEGGGIVSSVRSTRNASEAKLKREAKDRLRSMVRFGVTSVEGKTGYGLDEQTELKQLEVMEELNGETKIDIFSTFLGAHAIPEEYEGKRGDYLNLVTETVTPKAAEKGAEFCDVFCDRGAFTVAESREVLTRGKELGLKPKIHADEIAGTGGAELAAEVGAVSADHLLKASDEGIEAMKKKGAIGVLLPLTAFSLKEDYARARYMIDRGLPVSLATDLNPGSCYSESIPLLFALATLYMNMTLNETITALTLNAAGAVDRADELGTIEPGKQADMVILDAPDYEHISYHIGVNSVESTIKKGELLWKKSNPEI